MPTQRQKLVAHHVIGLEKSISATAKQIGASPTSVRGSLISYCIKMMPSLEPELTAWVEHKDRGRHRLAVIRAHKDQLMPSVDQPTRRKPTSEEQQAVETAAENCEVLRARLAKYEDADGRPVSTLAEQAREIERLKEGQSILILARDEQKRLANEYRDLWSRAALKAQPSGVVDAQRLLDWNRAQPEPRPIVIGREYQVAEACTRLNSSPVSAGDDAQYPPCDYCAEPLSYHPWHGSGLINGVESRHIHACDKCRHLLPTVSAGGVDERVPELSSFVAFADALGLDLRQSDDQWNSALALYEKLIAAYPQPSAALSAPSHGEQVRDRYTCIGKGGDYQLLGLAQGAGTLKGLNHMVYRNVDGVMFVREPEDFLLRMEKIAAAPSAGSQKEQGE